MRNRALGPLGPQTNWREKLVALSGVVEALLLFSLVIGGLYLGWFTPTEAGAAGAFGALAIGLVQRSLDFKGIVQSTIESVRISAMVLLLITGAVLFGRFLTVSRLPFELAEWAVALPVEPFVILLVVLGIYLVVTILIFFPLGVALGYDPV